MWCENIENFKSDRQAYTLFLLFLNITRNSVRRVDHDMWYENNENFRSDRLTYTLFPLVLNVTRNFCYVTLDVSIY